MMYSPVSEAGTGCSVKRATTSSGVAGAMTGFGVVSEPINFPAPTPGARSRDSFANAMDVLSKAVCDGCAQGELTGIVEYVVVQAVHHVGES